MKTQTQQNTQLAEKPGPIPWQAVPEFIQNALIGQGCVLLEQYQQRPHLPHIRFQYAPLLYQENLSTFFASNPEASF